MAIVKSLDVLLAAKTEKFDGGLAKSQAKFKQFTTGIKDGATKMGGFDKAIASTVARLGAFTAGVLSVGKALSVFNEMRDRIDQVSKSARVIGTTTETLSELLHAAELSNVGFEEFTTAMARFNRNIADASDDMGMAQRALAKLNIDAQRFQRLPLDEKLKVIADKMLLINDATVRTQIAMQLFGRSGEGVLNVIEGGRQGIDLLMQSARDLGIVIDTDMGQKVERMNDAITEMQKAWSGVAHEIVASVAPALTEFAETVESIFRDMRENININPAEDSRLAGINPFATPGFSFKARDIERNLDTPGGGGRDAIERLIRARTDLNEAMSGNDAPMLETLGKLPLAAEKAASAVEDFADRFADADVLIGEEIFASVQEQFEKEREKMRARADALMAAVQTPEEQFRETLDEARELFNLGFLDTDSLRRIIKESEKIFQEASKIDIGTAPGALERGGLEAFSAVAAAGRQSDLAIVARHSTETVAILRDLLREMRGRELLAAAPF